MTVWPASPRPSDDESDDDKRRRSSKKDKRSSRSSKHSRSDKHSSRHRHRHRSSKRYSDDSDSDDSEDDRRRRHRRSHKSRTYSDGSEDSEDERRRKHRERKRSAPADGEDERRARRRLSPFQERSRRHDDEDEWVEAPSSKTVAVSNVPSNGKAPAKLDDEDDEDDDVVGPMPLTAANAQGAGRNAYGGALRPGEGAAMAAYVAEGERIPRRGEIGLQSEEIERYEQAGYVMSGSRHRRMNAVRVRKEDQVISAEEKRGILKMQAEEKAKRENQIVASFREMVQEKMGPAGPSYES